MYINKKLSLGIIVSVLFISGCATTAQDCDPSQQDVSMLTKLNCDVGGGYSDSVRQNEQKLIAAREQHAHFQQIYEQISLQQKDTKASLEIQKKRNAQLERSLSNLLEQLKTKHSDQKAIQQQISQIEESVEKNEQTTANSPAEAAQKQQELQSLQKQLQHLEFSLGYN